jgi:hypothetical protein
VVSSRQFWIFKVNCISKVDNLSKTVDKLQVTVDKAQKQSKTHKYPIFADIQTFSLSDLSTVFANILTVILDLSTVFRELSTFDTQFPKISRIL